MHTEKFVIGIDANRRPLEKISLKIERKVARGGLLNILFAQAAVESLPVELNKIANEVLVLFPWGSLLAAVAGSNIAALKNIRQMCREGGLLRVVVGIDQARDTSEVARLKLPLFETTNKISSYYRDAEFELLDLGDAETGELKTSWARRLSGNSNRRVIQWTAQARK